jgi:hypothetical protein
MDERRLWNVVTLWAGVVLVCAAAVPALASPPGPPRNLRAQVSGTRVVLTWEAPSGAAGGVTYVIQAGSYYGRRDLAILPVGSATAFETSAPHGVFYVRAVAANQDGQGPPSNEIIVTVPGCIGVPHAPTGFTWAVDGFDATLSWIPPVSGPPDAYVLEAGTATGLTDLVAIALPGSQPAFSTAAPPGVYFVRVRGKNACGIGAASTESVVFVGSTWSIRLTGGLLEIAYGYGTSFPQVAVLDTLSGYFRMIYGPAAGWGTSVVLTPSFWSGGRYYQGSPVTGSLGLDGPDLVIAFSAVIGGITATGEVRLEKPGPDRLRATVTATASGSVVIDNRPGEAFKPLTLSSMQVSPTLWDTRRAVVNGNAHLFPEEGWVLHPAQEAQAFELVGGTSDWKVNAPTIGVSLEQPLSVTGWVTRSTDPNDDNIGFWAASDRVLPTWRYILTASRAPE